MYVKKELQALRHGNGAGVCVLYGSDNLELSSNKSGPTVTFNLRRRDGSWFGYLEVEKLASLSGIQLRTRCFCNPGACAKYLNDRFHQTYVRRKKKSDKEEAKEELVADVREEQWREKAGTEASSSDREGGSMRSNVEEDGGKEEFVKPSKE